jgi:hypothetical protein
MLIAAISLDCMIIQLNIVEIALIKRQTSRYLVGYLPVKFTKVLLENYSS